MKPISTDGIYLHIGRRVREERIKRGWTQEFLAERACLHASFIGQLERGLKKPSLKTIKILADIFGIKAGDIFDESPSCAKQHPIERKFADLLRDIPLQQQNILYQTIHQLARQTRKLLGTRR